MTDQDCIAFLQWALPKLRMRWQGFRRVRRQVCKRIARRMHELDLPDTASYRSYLEGHPAEWRVLDPLCRVTISRFYRDRSVFQSLEREVLPRLARNTGARGGRVLRCWSVGCASGEEPYTLAMLWRFAVKRRFPGIGLQIIATDPDEGMLERAWAGCYPASSLWELPEDRVRRGFTRRGKLYCIRDIVKADVEFRAQDVRRTMPDGPFDLVLCRNIVFTYFDEELQRQIMKEFRQRIVPGGILVTGVHEPLPLEKEGFIPLPGTRGIYLSVEQDQDA